MANFTLRKHEDFTFVLEDDPKTVYTLPAASNLGFKEAQLMANFGDETTIEKQGELVKEFILKYAPELEDKGLGDMEYYAILNAYIEHNQNQKKGLGES
jgi:hypothetical protein